MITRKLRRRRTSDHPGVPEGLGIVVGVVGLELEGEVEGLDEEYKHMYSVSC